MEEAGGVSPGLEVGKVHGSGVDGVDVDRRPVAGTVSVVRDGEGSATNPGKAVGTPNGGGVDGALAESVGDGPAGRNGEPGEPGDVGKGSAPCSRAAALGECMDPYRYMFDSLACPAEPEPEPPVDAERYWRGLVGRVPFVLVPTALAGLVPTTPAAPVSIRRLRLPFVAAAANAVGGNISMECDAGRDEMLVQFSVKRCSSLLRYLWFIVMLGGVGWRDLVPPRLQVT
jgi:hypothetical protein